MAYYTEKIYGNHLHWTFPSLSAFIAHNRENINPGLDADIRLKYRDGDPWSGGIPSTLAACQLATEGLPDAGIAALDTAKIRLSGQRRELNSVTFNNFYDTAGSYVDMGRYVTGEPDCMINYQLDTAPVVDTVIPLAINMAVLGRVTADAVTERGRAVVAILDAVQTVGRNVELWADMSSHGTYQRSYMARLSILIKPADAPLDASALMYCMTHTSFFRALGFNTRHTLPTRFQRALDVGRGYGSTVKGALEIARDYPFGTIYIPALQPGDDMERMTDKILRDMGVID